VINLMTSPAAFILHASATLSVNSPALSLVRKFIKVRGIIQDLGDVFGNASLAGVIHSAFFGASNAPQNVNPNLSSNRPTWFNAGRTRSAQALRKLSPRRS
jgi:hypothetical protein